LIPAKIRQFGSAEAMSISDEDHSPIAMTMAIGLECDHVGWWTGDAVAGRTASQSHDQEGAQRRL
jgi:hypothetical protein